MLINPVFYVLPENLSHDIKSIACHLFLVVITRATYEMGLVRLHAGTLHFTKKTKNLKNTPYNKSDRWSETIFKSIIIVWYVFFLKNNLISMMKKK